MISRNIKLSGWLTRIKVCMFFGLFFATIGCSAHNDMYFSLHPKVLQQAIEKCAVKKLSATECKQLQQIAMRVNALAYELHMNPQAYGQQILALQQTIATQTAVQESSTPRSAELAIILKNQNSLLERLAIIKWLESPES